MSSGPVITAVVMHTRFSFPKYRLDTPPTGRILDDSEERRQRVLTYHPTRPTSDVIPFFKKQIDHLSVAVL